MHFFFCFVPEEQSCLKEKPAYLQTFHYRDWELLQFGVSSSFNKCKVLLDSSSILLAQSSIE